MIRSILAELALAGSALWSMNRARTIDGGGFLLFALAALAGALVHGGFHWAQMPHDWLSRGANWVALILIVIGRVQGRVLSPVICFCLLAVALATGGNTQLLNLAALLLLVAGLWVQSKRPPTLVVIGALLFILAGLVIGTRDQLHTDAFHLTLAVAVALIAR